MRITFHGAARTVTGSQHLVEVNGKRILLDCGMYQGKRAEAERRNKTFQFEPASLDAVILSHAHIDHSGNLPNLYKQGCRAKIYCTHATAHLANIMLLDSAHIQETDAQHVSWKNERKGLPPVEPLYTIADAAMVAQNFHGRDYARTFPVTDGVAATFYDAGHILGSAGVALDIEEHTPAGPRRARLWFSGDIGRRKLPLLRDPVLPIDAHYLIMECTYGDKLHADPDLAYEELRQVVRRTLERKGKVIIPSFAVGRTQDLVYNLNRMFAEGQIPKVPVYVDSPLAVNASDVYQQHRECFDQETADFIAQGRHREALGFSTLTYTRSADESKALNERKDPMIIISASGMAENGRIRHHLKYNIEDSKNTILIVSWQAPNTLGRRLADRDKQVYIFGEPYDVRAEVATIGGLSAHAGQSLLVEYARASQDQLKGVWLVHGEPKAAKALTQQLAAVGLHRVDYPDMHESVDLPVS